MDPLVFPIEYDIPLPFDPLEDERPNPDPCDNDAAAEEGELPPEEPSNGNV